MNPPPVDPPCRCGHSRFVHFINPRKQRTTCSSWHGGRCKCGGYSPQEKNDAHPERPAP